MRASARWVRSVRHVAVGTGLGIAAVIALAVACLLRSPAPPGQEAPRPGEVPAAAAPEADGGVGSDADPTAPCRDDSDCVMSCDFPGECCPDGCECTRVYTRAFQDEIEAWKKANDCGPAGPPDCPSYDCPRPEVEYRAVCRDGACEAETSPIGD